MIHERSAFNRGGLFEFRSAVGVVKCMRTGRHLLSRGAFQHHGRHHMMHERTTSDRAAKLGCRGRYAVIGC